MFPRYQSGLSPNGCNLRKM